MNDRNEQPSRPCMVDGGRLFGSPPEQRKRNRILRNGMLAIGAEPLFACGFILIGFVISMLAGW